MLKLIIALLFLSSCTPALKNIPHDYTSHQQKWNVVLSKQYPAQGIGEKTFKRAMQAFNGCKGTYVTDKELYGKDYWTTLDEYMANSKKGDCEDFALCVYYKLKALGFKDKDLKFILGNLNNGSHAALDILIDNKHYIADVNYNYLIKADDYYDKVFKLSLVLQ